MASEKISRDIQVSVKTTYLKDYSYPDEKEFFYSYLIKISNLSQELITVLNRHWIIIDGEGEKEEIRGPGVVGKQPEIPVGKQHEYYSFCMLPTNFGTMEGSYGVMTERSETFRIEIPRFVIGEGLHEFPPNRFRRGQCVRHRSLGYVGVVADFDMYFARGSAKSDESEASSIHADNPNLMRPWYHVLIANTDRVAYVAEDHLEQVPLLKQFSHPLVHHFFDGSDDEIFHRNKKTWKDLS